MKQFIERPVPDSTNLHTVSGLEKKVMDGCWNVLRMTLKHDIAAAAVDPLAAKLTAGTSVLPNDKKNPQSPGKPSEDGSMSGKHRPQTGIGVLRIKLAKDLETSRPRTSDGLSRSSGKSVGSGSSKLDMLALSTDRKGASSSGKVAALSAKSSRQSFSAVRTATKLPPAMASTVTEPNSNTVQVDHLRLFNDGKECFDVPPSSERLGSARVDRGPRATLLSTIQPSQFQISCYIFRFYFFTALFSQFRSACR